MGISIEEMRDILGQKKSEPAVEVAEVAVDDDGKVKIYNSTLKALGKEVNDYAIEHLKPVMSEAIAKITASDVEALSAKLQDELEVTQQKLLVLAESVRVIEIKTPKKAKKLEGVQHNQFINLLTVVNAKQPVLMVGPAGTGKTHGAAMIAEALDLKFHSISVGSQTSKSDLQGYLDATHHYVRTQFREAYENGGVFLLDEADAGNSNVLILLNAALSNGYMAFPDGMVRAHEDFRMIATANTYGHGGSRQYVGRNQLDAATLDRFVVLNWDIDDKVEENMSGGTEEGLKWLRVVRAVRKRVVDELDLRVVISPRATLRGAVLLSAGMGFDDVLNIALVGNLPAGERDEIANLAKAAWIK